MSYPVKPIARQRDPETTLSVAEKNVVSSSSSSSSPSLSTKSLKSPAGGGQIRFSQATEHREGESLAFAAKQSKEILDAASCDAERIVADAKSAGYREYDRLKIEGAKAGRMEAAEVLLEAQAIRQHVIRDTEEELLDLVFAVAEEVVQTAITVDPKSITKRIKRALMALRSSTEVTIKLHPDDQPYFEESLSEITQEACNGITLAIQSDPTAARGSARLSSGSIVVDATVSGHLTAIRRHFLGTSNKC